jgi:hypothetical protein
LDIRQPTVSLKTDPEQNKVVRDGRPSPVSRLDIHVNGDTVELETRTTSGYIPVTLVVPATVLTELATRWLRTVTPKRLLAKWRKTQD